MKPLSELFTHVVDGQYLAEYEMNFGALSTFTIKSRNSYLHILLKSNACLILHIQVILSMVAFYYTETACVCCAVSPCHGLMFIST